MDLQRAVLKLNDDVQGIAEELVELRKDVATFKERLELLELEKAEAEEKARIAQEASSRWAPVMEARRRIWFRSDTGAAASMPSWLAWAIANRRDADVHVSEDEETDEIVFDLGDEDEEGEEVARIPRSLWSVLHKLLEGSAWLSRSSNAKSARSALAVGKGVTSASARSASHALPGKTRRTGAPK